MSQQNQPGLTYLLLSRIDPHPDNPRLSSRQDVVTALTGQMANGFDEAHAIIVRPQQDRYQIVSGHHRAEAATQAGLKKVPAWVRNMTDEEAYMQLVLTNTQSELTPLERGRHALGATEKYGRNGKDSIATYAKKVKRPKTSVDSEVCAAEVYEKCTVNGTPLGSFTHLVVIHAAPKERWPELAKQVVENEWTVAETEEAVAAINDEEPKVVSKPEHKLAVLKSAVTLSSWKEMGQLEREKALAVRTVKASFNEQKGDSIEWARWSWNPVTGCEHNCPYCYARDIANRFYPQKFEPSLIPESLNAPAMMKVPAIAALDIGYKNVFTCSMADLFGKWVPPEWVEAVLEQVRSNPQWNFLFLTKFPQRYEEFSFPDNAWIGTSIDWQARVRNAERAMAKAKGAVRWLSIEPMFEPLTIDFSLFQWIVIGGASPSNQTPEWIPPKHWVIRMTEAAHRAGCAVYWKTNITKKDEFETFRLREYSGHMEPDYKAPAEFQYLKIVS